MKHISNEDKAREIAKKLSHPNIDSFGDGDDEFDTRFYHTNKDAALQAMQWKDEQILQWLKENLAKETFTMFTSESQGVINFEPTIKAFEKFIKQ